jgi:plastocyanin
MRKFPGRGPSCAACLALFAAGVAADDGLTVRILDKAGKPVPNAVVYHEVDHPSPANPAVTAVVEQRGRAFVPDLTVIQTGTVVEFPNLDDVSHHVYSFARPNAFELPLYKREVTPTVRFDHPGVIILGCNIHDSMLGYIVVVDTPVFGITDEDGIAELTGAPPEADEYYVWSPRLDPNQALEVEAQSEDWHVSPVALHVGRKLKALPRTDSGSLAWDAY